MSDYPWKDGTDFNPYTEKNPYRHVGIQKLASRFRDYSYSARPVERHASHTSSSLEGLEEALNEHGGQTIWLEPGVYNGAYLSSALDVPFGTTIASDGAIISLETAGQSIFSITNDDVRITGIRFQGPMVEEPAVYGMTYGMELSASVEVDNCEFFGWPSAAIRVLDGEPRIRHNVIRDNMNGADDSGYPIYVEGGNPLIEYNFFNANQRGVAGDGSEDSSYRFENNLHGEDGGNYQTAQEAGGGLTTEIRNNEFRMQPDDEGNGGRATVINGTPDDVVSITNNWIWNVTPPGSQPNPSGSAAILQINHGSTEWENVTFSQNHHQHKKSIDSSVGIQRIQYSLRQQKRTDGRGLAKFSLPDGSYPVTVRHEDYDQPVSGTLVVEGEDTELTLQFD